MEGSDGLLGALPVGVLGVAARLPRQQVDVYQTAKPSEYILQPKS